MRGNCIAIDKAISGVCYYCMKLPRSLRLLAMTIRYLRNKARSLIALNNINHSHENLSRQ
ncbi:hypothetical protein D0Z68_00810 [Rickettsia japonica]|uniref:Palindromic element RPE4 domain-containing protein n=1 Tax=Rickettsia japonica TaxID=35790 RepID=A0ABM6YF50_RICJA|nr:hypothetical protein D0Z68_00810 [Rickettsia japonica]